MGRHLGENYWVCCYVFNYRHSANNYACCFRLLARLSHRNTCPGGNFWCFSHSVQLPGDWCPILPCQAVGREGKIYGAYLSLNHLSDAIGIIPFRYPASRCVIPGLQSIQLHTACCESGVHSEDLSVHLNTVEHLLLRVGYSRAYVCA